MTARVFLSSVVFGMLAGCATGGAIIIDPGSPPPQRVRIPPGQMPPPGKCVSGIRTAHQVSSHPRENALTCVIVFLLARP
jgi:hypothetical protein